MATYKILVLALFMHLAVISQGQKGRYSIAVGISLTLERCVFIILGESCSKLLHSKGLTLYDSASDLFH